jgi:hypothetical protein
MDAKTAEKIFGAAVVAYGNALAAKYAVNIAAQPEDQLKPFVADLLKTAGDLRARVVATKSEAHAEEVSARPDLGVAVNALLVGYVELKAPGKGCRPEKFQGADKTQWLKFRDIPNLIYTDGSAWALYRSGVRKGEPVSLGDDLTESGGGVVSEGAALQLLALFDDFFSWQPLVPTSPKRLAEAIAPLCRLIRRDVAAALKRPGSALTQLAVDWRRALFPEADDDEFADAYAQTLTYAYLLARFDGLMTLHSALAADQLDKGHALLAQALRLLTDPAVKAELQLGLDLLERSIGAVQPTKLKERDKDVWLYFYEDFLAAYDPKLRKDRGVYYTPAEVVQAQCALVAELLEAKLGRDLNFAHPSVVVLDPGAGTGTYLLSALQKGLTAAAEIYGEGARGDIATEMAANIYGFEVLVGAYAVAHLRLTQQILNASGSLPKEGVQILLADALESPNQDPKKVTKYFPQMQTRLAEEHGRARKVKDQVDVLVCLGNPPYDRQQQEPDQERSKRKGGWVRFGDDGQGGILEDFLRPAREAGAGIHLKNVYNDYVYFWRWALWKVLQKNEGPGVISFITAASYLRGPGFIGMREHMRRLFDEIWFIDLEGSNYGARKTENVFNIETPVVVAVGVRYDKAQLDQPAAAHYTKITGTRESKLSSLAAVTSFSTLSWQECSSEWHDPFLAKGVAQFFDWPLLTDLLPWQHSGVQFKRRWPIGETEELLRQRWAGLLAAEGDARKNLFREADHKVNRKYKDIFDPKKKLPPIMSLSVETPCPQIRRYGFRSFDRQFAIVDGRLADRPRAVLWRIWSPNQLYMTSLLTATLGHGPSAMVTNDVPDLHHFCNRGAKDVIPLWRDAEARQANIVPGLVQFLQEAFHQQISAYDVFFYFYGILAATAYADTFSEELQLSGPRIPITKSGALFKEISGLGRSLVDLHTRDVVASKPKAYIGSAKCVQGVSTAEEEYPETFRYDDATQILYVGTGEFKPVSSEVWGYSISGLQVLHSWLAYRMKSGAGKKSSDLDDVRPPKWNQQLTKELLHVIWVLEKTLLFQPLLAEKLAQVVKGEQFLGTELPTTNPEDRLAPEQDEEDAEQGTLEGAFEEGN